MTTAQLSEASRLAQNVQQWASFAPLAIEGERDPEYALRMFREYLDKLNEVVG